ncbi:restriction endonuclease, partial [Enterococcus faecium]
AKRAVKKAVIPGYGKKGTGWIKTPKKAAYNKVYKKTTFSFWDLFKYKKPVLAHGQMTLLLRSYI